ncbi:MAG TPA: hypothetical protein VGB64_15455 [Actinomycetota bacterium]
MSAEINHREIMSIQPEDSAKYVGAMIADEKRLVLVPLDPQEPWAAFKRLRTWMKDSKATQMPSSINLFETTTSLTDEAKVIPLDSRRKTS